MIEILGGSSSCSCMNFRQFPNLKGHEIQINFFTKKMENALAECNFSRGAGFARQRSRQELPEWAHDDPQGESGSFDHEVTNL